MILKQKKLNLIQIFKAFTNKRNHISTNVKFILILNLFFGFSSEFAFSSQTNTQKQENAGLFRKNMTEHNTEADISFRGDSGFKKENSYQLKGNVSIHQDKTTLTAQTAELFYKKAPSSNDSSSKMAQLGIDHANAKGNVKISKILSDDSAEFKASCDEVSLRIGEKKLIMKGHAKIWRNNEFLHAEVISINLDTGDISLQEPRGTFAAKQVTNTPSKL